MAEGNGNGNGRSSLREALPTDELGDEFQRLMSALVHRAVSSASERVGGISEKLEGLGGGSGGGGAVAKGAEKLTQGESPAKAALSAGAEGIKEKAGGLKDKVSEMFGGGGGGGKSGGKKLKVTNIIEQIDVGAPIDVVYNQWTQFQDFSGFMKKVEGVEQKDEQKLEFKAQVLWSHRTWEATIVDQVPDQRIVWRSSGPKGHVDGAVTFHELAPQLTRVLVVLEYHPQGLFERTGNLWRAQGRRVRLELKHFRRHVMTETMLHPDEVQGWRGEIHDGDVVKSDEEGRQDEGPDDAEDSYDDEQDDQDEQDEGPEDQYDEDEPEEDEDDYEGPEDEYDEDEPEEDEDEDEDEDEGPTDEYDDEEDEEDEDEGYSEDDEYEDSDEDSYDDSYDDSDEDEYDDTDEDEPEEDEQPRRRSRRPVGAGRR